MNTKFAELLKSDRFYPHHLEGKYPKIVVSLSKHWVDGTFLAYVDGLMFDERGDRHGFSSEILEEIFALQVYYRTLQPERPLSIDTWADSVEMPEKRQHEL